MSSITIRTPATTANLGAGFDCIGAALNLYNTFTFSPIDGDVPLQITIGGAEAARVEGTRDNLAYQAFCRLFQQIDRPLPPVKIEIELGIPLARGLGSSATAIVGGLVGANFFAGSPLSTSEVMELAIEMEGHPDNVVPAQIGGCRLAATGSKGWEIADIPWDDRVGIVVAIPDFELSTEAARSVLPATYSRADAVFNIAHLGLLLRGLATANPDWLRAALADRIHQPYRQSLITGYGDVEAAALAAGSYGMVISGAGPTLLALCPLDRSPDISIAMSAAWQSANITSTAKVLQLDTVGTVRVDG
jgi:homoserine kinase